MKKMNQENSYLQAKNRLDRIKSFYTHLIIYLMFNSFFGLLSYGLITVKINGLHYSNIYMAIGWGGILIIHGLIVFSPIMSLLNKWEERKMKAFMQEENNKNWE